MKYLILICILGFISGGECQLPWEPVPNPTQYWMDLHNYFLWLGDYAGELINVLFLGESWVQLWAIQGKDIWEENYAPLVSVNFGIGGEFTQWLLWRIDNGELDKLINCKVVVIEMGFNNIFSGLYTNDEVFIGLSATLNRIRAKLPNTKILLFNLLPVCGPYHYINERSIDYNNKIASFDNGDSIRYLNMWDDFIDENGFCKREYYIEDDAHLSEAGYVQWANSMRPLFEELYNSTNIKLIR